MGLLASLPSLFAVLAAYLKLKADVREVHLSLNSRLTELLEQTTLAAHAAGREEAAASIAAAHRGPPGPAPYPGGSS